MYPIILKCVNYDKCTYHFEKKVFIVLKFKFFQSKKPTFKDLKNQYESDITFVQWFYKTFLTCHVCKLNLGHVQNSPSQTQEPLTNGG